MGFVNFIINSKDEIEFWNPNESASRLVYEFHPLENRIDSINWLLKKKWFYKKEKQEGVDHSTKYGIRKVGFNGAGTGDPVQRHFLYCDRNFQINFSVIIEFFIFLQKSIVYDEKYCQMLNFRRLQS
ncbi:MAG: hypothetical protein LBR26_11195 [Prevotella sp.]|nr:hypothetical protein [Prevotella sp.]